MDLEDVLKDSRITLVACLLPPSQRVRKWPYKPASRGNGYKCLRSSRALPNFS